MPKSNGIVYLSFGSVFVAQALFSAETLRNHNPELPITIIANVPFPGVEVIPFWSEDLDTWLFLDRPSEENRNIKTNIARYVAYDKCIYLDCDTFVTGNLDAAWKFLEKFDIALRLSEDAQNHSYLNEYEVFSGLKVPDAPQLNGGVVLFKKNAATLRFFDSWSEEFRRSKLKFDQPALITALFKTEVRLLTLDSGWNGGFKPLKKMNGVVPRVVHYHSSFDFLIEKKLFSYHEKLELKKLADKGAMAEYIRRRKEVMSRNEPLKFYLRRLYRRYWYWRYPQ